MSDFSLKLERQIKSLGVSPQGERFLLKALYPPGNGTQVAIPDQTWHPTMRFDGRPSTSITGPPALIDGDSWDCMIIAPPGDALAAVIVTGQSPVDFSIASAVANTFVKALHNVPTTAASGNRTYHCTTRTAAGALTAFTGVATSNPIGVDGFRSTYRGLTVHNTSSALYNGGTLYAAQVMVPSVPSDTLLQSVRGAVNFTTSMTNFNVPMDEDSMTQMCPGTQATEAKDGCFLPLRLLGPAQDFAREGNAYSKRTVGVGATYADLAVSIGTTSITPSYPTMPCSPVFTNGKVNLAAPYWNSTMRNYTDTVDDAGYDNVATGVVIIRGLHPNATFNLQMHVGLEVCLDATSAFRSLASASAPYDPVAIRAYYEIAARMPFSYPASYNSLGLLLPYLAKALAFVASSAAPHVGRFLLDHGRKAMNHLEGKYMQVPPQPPVRQAPVKTGDVKRTHPAKNEKQRVGSARAQKKKPK